jgi:hypothetical protein
MLKYDSTFLVSNFNLKDAMWKQGDFFSLKLRFEIFCLYFALYIY